MSLSSITVNLLYIAVVSLAVLVGHPATAQEPESNTGAGTRLPLTYPGLHLPQGDGSQNQCPSELQRQNARSEINNGTLRLLRESVLPLLQTGQLPATEPPPVSGGYSCDGSTGWRRVAYLDMTDSSQQCPSVWQEITTPHRVCGRRSTTGSCEGLIYSAGSAQYNQVCGRIIGYQIGLPDSFYRITSSNSMPFSIDTFYVDGVSVTHGSPRTHIWTFSNGLDEGIRTSSTCFCVTGSSDAFSIPSYVGQNYFCETGLTLWNNTGGNGVFWPDGDPLWDGQGCGSDSSTCCTFNSPPFFNTQLPFPTTDDIEVRICGDQGIGVEDSPIQLMELYVK